jgi:hypothetical protein
MALSYFDQQYLNPEEQKQMLEIQNNWANASPQERESYHTLAESMRAKYGYSGGVSGNEYIQIGTVQQPTINPYESQWNDTLQNLYKDISTAQYQPSPYEALIAQSISQAANRKFEYDPNTDPAYQAYRQRLISAGESAYQDNLAGLSAATGGRPNTWAASVASQARNQYMLQAETAMLDFEDRAYSRYQAETDNLYKFISVLDSMDTKYYNRWRDSINDKKELFNMVMQLEDADFQKYQYQVEQSWKQFDAETANFQLALDKKKMDIQNALDRVEMLGYVDNKAAAVLGVPTGTLSKTARERAEAMEDYIKKQSIDLETYKKQKAIDYEYDMKLINAKVSSGSSSGSGSSSSKPLTTTEIKAIGNETLNFDKLVKSKDYQSLKHDAYKMESINDFIDSVIKKGQYGSYGARSLEIAEAILNNVMQHEEYQRVLNAYQGAVEAAQKGSKEYMLKDYESKSVKTSNTNAQSKKGKIGYSPN